MNSYKRSNQVKLALLFIYILGGVTFSIKILDVTEYLVEYCCVLLSYYFVGIIFLAFIFKASTVFIFEPIILVGFLEFMTYSVAPLISILTHETDLRGHYIMDGCLKATLIYVVSFLAILLGYYGIFNERNKYEQLEWDNEPLLNDVEYENEGTKQKVVIVSLGMWLLGFIFFTRYFINQGYGVLYILTLGMAGNADRTQVVESSIDVLFNMRFFMPTACLYISQYSKKKWLAVVLYTITFMEFMAYGFRNILVLLIAAPLVVYYAKRMKMPSNKTIMWILVSLFVLIGVVEIFRASVRQGMGVVGADWERLNLMSLWRACQGNFDLYKTLYGCVTYVPSQHFYTLGDTLIILTLVTCIPRAIWPGKPVSYVRELSAQFIGAQALKEAWALSTFCEYYVEFGILGCIICSFILGKFCSKMKKWYMRRDRNIDSIIMYAVVYPMLMLLAVRGYMPINFWQIIFLIAPVYAMKILKKAR